MATSSGFGALQTSSEAFGTCENTVYLLIDPSRQERLHPYYAYHVGYSNTCYDQDRHPEDDPALQRREK